MSGHPWRDEWGYSLRLRRLARLRTLELIALVLEHRGIPVGHMSELAVGRMSRDRLLCELLGPPLAHGGGGGAAVSACEAEPLDGHEHTDDAFEYYAVCARGHERRGLVCGACARVLPGRGPAAVTCADCPEDDPRPRILIPADLWDAFLVHP